MRGPSHEEGAHAQAGAADGSYATAAGSVLAQETTPPLIERPSPRKGSKKWPGKQPGSPGVGRTQKLAVTCRCSHRPESYAACGEALAEDVESQAYMAWDEIDIVPPVEGSIGPSAARRRVLEVCCAGGHRPTLSGRGFSWTNGV